MTDPDGKTWRVYWSFPGYEDSPYGQGHGEELVSHAVATATVENGNESQGEGTHWLRHHLDPDQGKPQGGTP